MKGPDGFVQAYNLQVAVDERQLIVGQTVTQETNDKKQLLPMITRIEQQSGITLPQLLADAGYCSDENITVIATTTSTRTSRRGSKNMASARGPVRVASCQPPPPSSTGWPASCTRRSGRRSMPAQAIVEPVIGQIKHARGFRQFLLRGFEKVRGEWSLVCAPHNMLKLYRLCG